MKCELKRFNISQIKVGYKQKRLERKKNRKRFFCELNLRFAQKLITLYLKNYDNYKKIKNEVSKNIIFRLEIFIAKHYT